MIMVTCRTCGNDCVVDATDEQYVAWKEGHMLIQNAMPDIPKEQRELLLSGICGVCFNRMFRDDDDEDYEARFDYE